MKKTQCGGLNDNIQYTNPTYTPFIQGLMTMSNLKEPLFECQEVELLNIQLKTK